VSVLTWLVLTRLFDRSGRPRLGQNVHRGRPRAVDRLHQCRRIGQLPVHWDPPEPARADRDRRPPDASSPSPSRGVCAREIQPQVVLCRLQTAHQSVGSKKGSNGPESRVAQKHVDPAGFTAGRKSCTGTSGFPTRFRRPPCERRRPRSPPVQGSGWRVPGQNASAAQATAETLRRNA